LAKPAYWVQESRCWQGAAGRPCEGRRHWGCPGLDTAPTDPVQGTAEPRSHGESTSGKTCARKGKHPTERRGEPQGVRISSMTLEQIFMAPMRTPRWSRWKVPEGTAACGEPMLKQKFFFSSLKDCSRWERDHARAGEMCERVEAAERSCAGLTTAASAPYAACGGRWRSLE